MKVIKSDASINAEQEGANEMLKEQNQMEWVGRMNNIRNRAEEIVYNEIFN